MINREWLVNMADKESGCNISVGGLVSELRECVRCKEIVSINEAVELPEFIEVQRKGTAGAVYFCRSCWNQMT